jgi:hypothetical protein
VTTTQDQPPAQVQETDKPAAFLAGKFALYHTPDGGILLCFKANGADQEERKHIPGTMVTLLNQMEESGGLPSPKALLKMYKEMRKAG